MHGGEADAKVDGVGWVALLVEADAACFDEYVFQCVGVGNDIVVGVGNGF